MATVVEFLTAHGVDHRVGGQHRHVRPGWVGVDCPRCGPGSLRFHAGIQEDASRAACWRCGGMNPLSLIAEVSGISMRVVREALGSHPRPLASRVVSPNKSSGILYHPLLKSCRGPYRRYLEMRGFDSTATEELWGVQSTGAIGPLAWRLWIPIRNKDGLVVSWTTRAIGKRQPRYISASPEQETVNHKTLLYGEDLADHAVVVVEGPLDAWAIGPGGVAIMGLMTTPQQVARIGSHPLRAICCDKELSALRRAERLADMLQCYPGETHIVELETGKDPADADRAEIEDLRRAFLD